MRIASTEEINVYKNYLLNNESDLALKELRRLHQKYPSDGYIIRELGSLLLKMDINVSEAMFLLTQSINKKNYNYIKNETGTYYLNKGNFDKAEEDYSNIIIDLERSLCFKLYGLLKVYMHNGEYQKGLDCWYKLKEHRDSGLFNIEHFNNCRTYLFYKLGKCDFNKFAHPNYFEQQLFNYDKDLAIEHIYKHLNEEDKDHDYIDDIVNMIFKLPLKRGVFSSFYEDTDVEELYNYCSKCIVDRNPNTYSTIDYYTVELDRTVGITYDGVESNKVEVATIPNSKDILSIYPMNTKHVNKNVEIKDNKREPYKKVKKYNNKKKKNYK